MHEELLKKFKDLQDRLPVWRKQHGIFQTDIMRIEKSAEKIYRMFESYKQRDDFIGMDMCRKFLEMGFTRARRYANHKDGKKYNSDRTIKPQEPDALTSNKALSAKIFKNMRDLAAYDEKYQMMRKQWRDNENEI